MSRSKVRRRVDCVFASFALALVGPVGAAAIFACCMVPLSYPGDVDQTRQEAVVIFDKGREVLLLRVHPTFPDFDYGPDKMAWIVTVPEMPRHYDAVDAAVFDSAQALFHKLDRLASNQKPRELSSLMPSAGIDSAAKVSSEAGLVIGDKVEVGPYEITPVQAPGNDGATLLNAYLDERGFPNESIDELTWFTSRDFTFLCVEIRPEDGAPKFSKNVELPALQIDFRSERPYYPARYSARQGNFALGMTIISSEPLQRESLANVRRKLRARAPDYDNLFTTKPLPDELQGPMAQLSGREGVVRWYVNPIASWGFNSEGNASGIASWNDDIFWEVGSDADMPPAWYHGDGPATISHRMRQNQAALMIASVAIFFGVGALWLLWRWRRRLMAVVESSEDRE